METVADFIFLGSKINGDCSHEIKRCLLLGRKAMTNLDSVLKSRDITLLTKICIIKVTVFPAVMYGCESHICDFLFVSFVCFFLSELSTHTFKEWNPFTRLTAEISTDWNCTKEGNFQS